MKSINIKTILLIAITVCGLFHGNTFAGLKNAPSNAAKLQESYMWYDGQQERQVWLNPGLVAEFNPVQGSLVNSTVKSLYSDAVPVSKLHGSVRFWRLGSGAHSDVAAINLRKANQAEKYSPVLHDSPSSTGRKRALPGNIIIYLNPVWDGNAVNAWVNQHQLEIVKKLDIGPNIYVIKTGPGLEALSTANTLYKSGEVIAAFPDWWEEVTTR